MASADAPRLFGTDGVRGVAGRPPLDRPTVRRLGAALVRALPRGADVGRVLSDVVLSDVGRVLSDPADQDVGRVLSDVGRVLPDPASQSDGAPHFLIGRDTRESGGWIEAELAHGAAGAGAIVTSAGVVPTPAVAYLTRTGPFDAGVVISASHNPYEDNGIKVFSHQGEKCSERVERDVEAMLVDASWQARSGEPGPVTRADLVGGYLDHLRAILSGPSAPVTAGFRLAIDCANGATTDVAPRLFGGLGFETVVIGNQPDGRNINLRCGSTHPDALARVVVERACRMGVAFDGDGDRAIFVDARGRVVDGDAVLFMCARQLQREGRLKGSAIVATVMSNIGLELALRPHGIDLVRCAVGDKYVMEEMIARGLSLGGEQSGHIIFSDYLFTGDGLCTALNVIRTVLLTGRTLGDLASDLVTHPQVLLNVRVREKVDLRTVPAVAAAMSSVEARVEGRGRLLVRYSGTEPLLRVMLEGKDHGEIQKWAQEIVDVVKKELG
ncbi:MAG: phosphoglucosamine mutase [Acidobacteria bacterium]|nr:phosphoglucosamine mutase [Acidobacteriota bacterium]